MVASAARLVSRGGVGGRGGNDSSRLETTSTDPMVAKRFPSSGKEKPESGKLCSMSTGA